MGSEFDQQNEAKIIMSKENMELNKQVEQLGCALKEKSREVAQMQRRADLQVAGEKMERARVQAIVIANKKREQKSNKRQQKRLKEDLETTQRSLEETREEKREEEKQTAAAERNQKKAMRTQHTGHTPIAQIRPFCLRGAVTRRQNGGFKNEAGRGERNDTNCTQ